LATVCPFIDHASKSAHVILSVRVVTLKIILTHSFQPISRRCKKQKELVRNTQPPPQSLPLNTPSPETQSPHQPRATVTRNNQAQGETINDNMYYKKDLSLESEVLGGLAPAQKTLSGRAFIFGSAGERIHDGLVLDTVTPPWWRDVHAVFILNVYIVSDDRRRRRGKHFAVTCPSQQR